MVIVGHRGAAGEVPENTLAGIAYALKLGIRDFEIDIRQCRDGVFAVLHDSNLLRTTGENIFLHEVDSEELITYFAHHQQNSWPALDESQFGNCYIPTLAQILTYVPPGTSFQLEIKSDDTTDINRVVTEISRQFPLGCQALRDLTISFTSFDVELLRQLKAQCPHIGIGVVSHEDPLEALELAEELGATHCCLHYERLLSPDLNLRETIRTTALHVSLWTVNELSLVSGFQQLGVDSLITDLPSLLLRELGTEEATTY